MFAHYYKSSKKNFVIISETYSPIGTWHVVKNKREARKLAASLNAQCWNF